MTPNSSSRIKGATAHQPILPSPSKPLLPIYTPPPIVAREDQTLTCPLPILRSNPISIPVRTHRTRSSRRRPTNCHHPLACPICSAPSIDWISQRSSDTASTPSRIPPVNHSPHNPRPPSVEVRRRLRHRRLSRNRHRLRPITTTTCPSRD